MDFQMKGTTLRRYKGAQEIVHVPPGVVRIGARAFEENDTIQEVYLPDGVENVGDEAFQNCSKLRKVVTPDSLQSIGKWAFAYCESLEEVSLGSHLWWIDCGAFFDCDHMKQIAFPPALQSLGSFAFGCCMALHEVDLPGGVTSIGENCFELCLGMRRVSIPASLVSIGTRSFSWCGSRLKLEVSQDNPRFSAQNGNLLSKDGSTLYCCPASLGAVSLEDSITILGDQCLADSDISRLELPPGLREIRDRALSDCKELRELKLPDGLTWIGESAFNSTGLTELVIPASVMHIGTGALSGCKLHHLTILGSEINADDLCWEMDLQPDAMLTADNLEIKDYPNPFQAIHGLRSYAARRAAGEAVPKAVQRRFRKYLARNYQKHWDEPQIFALTLELKTLPISGIEAALQKASELKNPSITAALLQYQHEVFSQEQVEEQWRRQIRREE